MIIVQDLLFQSCLLYNRREFFCEEVDVQVYSSVVINKRFIGKTGEENRGSKYECGMIEMESFK